MRHKITKKNILFFGPIPPPITGQAIAFSEIYYRIELGNKFLVNTSSISTYKIFTSIRVILRVTGIFVRNRIDLVYFTCSRTKMGFVKDLYLVFLSAISKAKIINHVHGADFYTFYKNSGILEPIIKATYKKVDVSIVLLAGMKADFKDFPHMDLYVIGNSYPTKFNDIDVDYSLQSSDLLFFSNIMATKGIFEYLEAADHLLNETTNLKCSIAGGYLGDDEMSRIEVENKFQTRYNELKSKWGDRIQYCGIVGGDEKLELFLKSSIFVLPTYYKTEAFPISILEAMRTGNAIITTNHNYLPEIISNQNGFLVKCKSVGELTHAINRLMMNKALLKTIQQTNVNVAKDFYSPDRYLTDVKNVISSYLESD